MTPKDARMKNNELDVKMNISLQAKSNRKYPVDFDMTYNDGKNKEPRGQTLD